MKEERKGELYIFSEAVIWSFFPIVTTLTFAGVSPLVSLSSATFLSTFFFIGVMLYKGTWHELKNWTAWRYGLFIALFTGIGFYALYYIGLSHTSSGNASLIVLFEILTSYVIFNFVRKEPFPTEHMLGAFFMVVGALILVGRGYSGFAAGDLFILAATLFAPFGNVFQQKARTIVSSETVMFLRSALSSAVLIALALFLGESFSLTGALSVWPVLLINGILIFGLSKLFWIEGIHRISVTKAILLQSMSPIFTILLAWALLSEAPTVWQLSALLPFILGAVLLTGHFRLKKLPSPFHL
jgi:drug/metabolite transporter (DMT)-like permease